jgi:hypothetical protein
MKGNIINIRITEDLKSELDFISLEEGKSISTIVRDALQEFIENYNGEPEEPEEYISDSELPDYLEYASISSRSFANLIKWIRNDRDDPKYSDLEKLHDNIISFFKNAEAEAGSKHQYFKDIDELNAGLHNFIESLSTNMKDLSLSNYNNGQFDRNKFNNYLNELGSYIHFIKVVYLNVSNYDS